MAVFCLRDVNIYDNIAEEELIRIAKTAIESQVPQGEILFAPDRPAQQVYVIKSGEIELYHEKDGKRVVFETLFPGDVFGDFGAGPTDYFAQATRASFLCQTPTHEFLDIVREHPEVSLNLMQTLASKIHDYERKIASLNKPAKQQILDEIKRLQAKNEKSFLSKMFRVPLRLSHQKLSEKTGLNRVTVTKLLGELREEGLLSIDAKTGEIQVV